MTGRELKQLRGRLGYSQPDLAAYLSVHPMTVSRWERGTNRIPEAVSLAIRILKPRRATKRGRSGR